MYVAGTRGIIMIIFSGVSMFWGCRCLGAFFWEGAGGAPQHLPAREIFFKTGSKIGPSGAFCSNCKGWR